MSALNTDLYQLTMAAGYFAAGKVDELATFELSVRRLPAARNFLVAAGLQQALEYLLTLEFTAEDIDYLRSLPSFKNTPPEFFGFLRALRFTGGVYALPEGTPVFPGEPVLIVRAPLIQAQLVETYLLSTIAFQTIIASKAARCVLAAEGRAVVEFGSRRAHSAGAGPLAGRAAYIAGCAGTSNTEAGLRFGIPVFGTAAHSWVMSFASEKEAYLQLQHLLGESTIYVIDTYDTLEGARLAASLGRPIWGVRLDSGDLEIRSKEVRRILAQAGLHDARIVATSDLNERRIAALVQSGAPIDSFGVGTELSTSADAPSLSVVYKLVELQRGKSPIYTAKYSEDKSTLPGGKQVYRSADHDLVALQSECNSGFLGEPLLRPVIIDGTLLEPMPTAKAIRESAGPRIAALPPELLQLDEAPEYPVLISPNLRQLAEAHRSEQLVRLL
ncbi:MAG: nicotinate phosphoribosyltransferase [Bryobacteraceae bacterium]